MELDYFWEIVMNYLSHHCGIRKISPDVPILSNGCFLGLESSKESTQS